MKRCKPLAIMLVFTVIIFIGGYGSALADDNYDDVYQNEADKNTEMSSEDIKDENIAAFIAAAKEVQEIRADYAEKIYSTEDTDYKELRKQAVDEMVESIENQGLDEKTYRGIAYHAKEDKDLLPKSD